MGISLKPTHLSRYKDIAHLFFKYGRSELVEDPDLNPRGGVNGHNHNAAQPQVPAEATELASDLEKMGPIFIKIGQLLSTRSDMLPVPFIEALSRLQDHVEPFAFKDVQQIVEHELGMRINRAFSRFDPEPLSAASLGQVHRAAMRDGREVAVKIQRPNIREKLVDDLDSLQEVAEFLDHNTDIGKRFEFQNMLGEFRTTLLHELDYRMESQNLQQLGRNLAEFDRIVVPQPVEDYTTSRVLTMQFIGGSKIKDLSPLIKTELDGNVLAEQLFRAYLKQILVDGFFHADPHPGNILLTPDSRIALLDLGMVGRLAPRMQDALMRILLMVSEGRGEEAADLMIGISRKQDESDPAKYTRMVVDIVGQNKNADIRTIALGRVMLEMNRVAADCGIRAPAEAATLAKTLLNLDEAGRSLDSHFNPNESIRRNATTILQRRLTSSLSPGSVYAGLLEAKDFIQHIPGKVNKILDTVANNDLRLQVDAIDETRLMNGFQKVANRITAGLVVAALIIGAALLMRVDTPFRIFGYPGLAIIMFLLAAAGGVALLVHIFFYDEPAQ